MSEPMVQSSRPKLIEAVPPGFANKLARAVWGVVWLLLYRPSPRPAHGWRRMLLRLFGAKIASGVKPYPTAVIWAPWNLEMGKGSTLGDGVDCYSVAKITVGEYATVSQRAFLCSASRNVDLPEMTLALGPISLEARSWVAAEAFLAPGVTIGEGGVAAARAVVTSSIAPWTIFAGNPAKYVRDRRRLDD